MMLEGDDGGDDNEPSNLPLVHLQRIPKNMFQSVAKRLMQSRLQMVRPACRCQSEKPGCVSSYLQMFCNLPATIRHASFQECL